MKLEHLRTLVALAEHRTFADAGAAVGLSQSAVSLHVKALEESLGTPLLDRSHRPPVLNERGQALVEQARRMLQLCDEIAGIASADSLVGSLSIGAVPTALGSILPPALKALRTAHPHLKIQVQSGLSGELATRLRAGMIDAALTTGPGRPVAGLKLREIGREPLVVIAPAEAPQTRDAELLAAYPFIWFNRQTWAGSEIERLLAARAIEVAEEMEVDSLEAIVAMVGQGLGVAIVPQRLAAPPFPPDLKAVPFGDPPATRTLAFLERRANPKRRLTDAFYGELRQLAG